MVELQSLSLQYQKAEGVTRDPLFTGQSVPNEYFNLGMQLDLVRFVGIDANLLAATDQTQFHYAGLMYFAYVRPTSHLQVGWSHLSMHALDSVFPEGYPLQNCIEVRFTIYESGKPREALF